MGPCRRSWALGATPSRWWFVRRRGVDERRGRRVRDSGVDDGRRRLELRYYATFLSGHGLGGGWIELRAGLGGCMRSEFFDARDSHDRLARRALQLSAFADVYLGVALRHQKRGDKSSVGEVWAVWADCDSPEARNRLAAFGPTPSMVVASPDDRVKSRDVACRYENAFAERCCQGPLHGLSCLAPACR